jgi:hypothetical protein
MDLFPRGTSQVSSSNDLTVPNLKKLSKAFQGVTAANPKPLWPPAPVMKRHPMTVIVRNSVPGLFRPLSISQTTNAAEYAAALARIPRCERAQIAQQLLTAARRSRLPPEEIRLMLNLISANRVPEPAKLQP